MLSYVASSSQADAAFESRVSEVLQHSYGSSDQKADTGRAIAELKRLSTYPVTIAHLSQTGAGGSLTKLSREHPDQHLREAVLATLAAWRSTIMAAGQLGQYLQQRGNVSIPSSSCAGLRGVYQQSPQ